MKPTTLKFIIFFIRTRLSAKTIDPAFRSTNINMELVSIIVTNMTSGKKKSELQSCRSHYK